MPEIQYGDIGWINKLDQYSGIALSFENAGSVVQLLRQYAETTPTQEAVIIVSNPHKPDMEKSITYQQLDIQARRVASYLQKNYPAGSRILLLYPTSLDFVVAFYACLYAGMIAIPAPIPGQYQHERRRLKAIAENAGIAAVCTVDTYMTLVQKWQTDEALSAIDCLISDQPSLGDPENWQVPSIQRDSIALLQYTSGSTGDPKGVMISHHNLLHNIANICRAHRVTNDYRFGGWIPLYHDMGLMGQLLPPLLIGSTCVLMTPTTFLKRPHLWLVMIDKYNIQHSCAPNFAFELCHRRIKEQQIADLDLSRWKAACNGSEPIQASSIREFATYLAPTGFRQEALCPCYGMAETTVFISGFTGRMPVIQHADATLLEHHQFALQANDQAAHDLVSCGVPFGYDVRIVDHETREVLSEGQIGEIWLRGDSVAAGYWNNPEATADIFQASTSDGDGAYLRTGDFGLIYEDEIYITGRIKEMLIVNGRNHYPQDIEHQLRLHHPELRGRFGAVFSVPMAGGQEAVIVTHELQRQLDQNALHKIASEIKITVQQEFGIAIDAVALLKSGSVQRTTSGKIQRTDMRRLFLHNQLTPVYAEISAAITTLCQQHASSLTDTIELA